MNGFSNIHNIPEPCKEGERWVLSLNKFANGEGVIAVDISGISMLLRVCGRYLHFFIRKEPAKH